MRRAIIVAILTASVTTAMAQSGFSPNFYFDAAGNPVATAMQNNRNGITLYYGADGEPIGTALPAGPRQRYYYGADGGLLGSSTGPLGGYDDQGDYMGSVD
jgi:YD repeat-containing protein